MSAQTIFVWIAVVFLIAFNTAAALTHMRGLTVLALVLTALIASFVLLVGIWNGVKAIKKA